MGNALDAMKRKYLRVVASMEVEVCLLPGDDSNADMSILSCTARDISGGGLSFYGSTLYPEFSLLRLCIPMNSTTQIGVSNSEDIIKVMGKVMWSRKKNDDAERFATGVQFLNIYEGDFKVLEKFVQENFNI